MSITFYTEADEDGVNVSNTNGLRLQEALGFEPDYCGELPASEFHAAVLLALALVPADAGVPATQQGNVIDCGRPEGYLQMRLEELHALSSHPAAQTVYWA